MQPIVRTQGYFVAVFNFVWSVTVVTDAAQLDLKPLTRLGGVFLLYEFSEFPHAETEARPGTPGPGSDSDSVEWPWLGSGSNGRGPIRVTDTDHHDPSLQRHWPGTPNPMISRVGGGALAPLALAGSGWHAACPGPAVAEPAEPHCYWQAARLTQPE